MTQSTHNAPHQAIVSLGLVTVLLPTGNYASEKVPSFSDTTINVSSLLIQVSDVTSFPCCSFNGPVIITQCMIYVTSGYIYYYYYYYYYYYCHQDFAGFNGPACH
jgi:hypothetical protein